jgi:hypothetical protein
VAEATAVRCACMSHKMSRAACLQCITACGLICIVCGHLWLMERATVHKAKTQPYDVHWGNVPLHVKLGIHHSDNMYNCFDA